LSGDVFVTSLDGRKWQISAPASGMRTVRHTPLGFVAAGPVQSVLSSDDGLVWNEVRFNLGGFQSIAFGLDRVVLVGRHLVGSRDLRSWQALACEQRFGCRNGEVSPALTFEWVLFGNGAFLAGATVSGGLHSTDGEVWNPLTAAFPGLQAAFDGGWFLALTPGPPTGALNESVVKASRDGLTWLVRTTARAITPFDTCATKRCVALGDAILLIP
jgi:hypothetical protein